MTAIATAFAESTVRSVHSAREQNIDGYPIVAYHEASFEFDEQGTVMVHSSVRASAFATDRKSVV